MEMIIIKADASLAQDNYNYNGGGCQMVIVNSTGPGVQGPGSRVISLQKVDPGLLPLCFN